MRKELGPLPHRLPKDPASCITLLPLLLLPLFYRRRKCCATADFVEAMLDAGLVSEMPERRRRWLVSEADYAALRDRSQDGIRLADLLEPTEYSETDALALERKMGIEHDQAAVLVSAQRTKVFCTEDADLRKVARLLEIDVVNKDEFLERFAAQMKKNED